MTIAVYNDYVKTTLFKHFITKSSIIKSSLAHNHVTHPSNDQTTHYYAIDTFQTIDSPYQTLYRYQTESKRAFDHPTKPTTTTTTIMTTMMMTQMMLTACCPTQNICLSTSTYYYDLWQLLELHMLRVIFLTL